MNKSYKFNISFIDLNSQQKRIKHEIDAAINKVLDHGKYINGPEVQNFEKSLAQFSGVKYAVSCGSGTDALMLPLMAWDITSKDAVFVPSFTFVATAEVVALLKATPIFVDVKNDTYNMCPDSLLGAIEHAKKIGLTPKVVIPVDLFGQPAEYDKINEIAKKNNMFVLSDAAQSFGASIVNNKVGSLSDVTSTSFFPTKPLGCYGDGGAILTDNDDLAESLFSLRAHGGGKDKYDNINIGVNSRLDTVQAAILIEKLKILENEIKSRDIVAKKYTNEINDNISCPIVYGGYTSAWAQYTVSVRNREAVVANLKSKSIPTAIYYPKPLHMQKAFKSFPCSPYGLNVSENLSKTVISLPIHPYISIVEQEFIIESLNTEIQ